MNVNQEISLDYKTDLMPESDGRIFTHRLGSPSIHGIIRLHDRDAVQRLRAACDEILAADVLYVKGPEIMAGQLYRAAHDMMALQTTTARKLLASHDTISELCLEVSNLDSRDNPVVVRACRSMASGPTPVEAGATI